MCVCVIPSNGTRLTDTSTSFEDTGDEDENENMKPRCSGRGIEITLYIALFVLFLQCMHLVELQEVAEGFW